MSTEKALFTALPNEVIYCVFEFLATSDILKAFTRLNCRYRDAVRYYVKHIDLTDNWEIYRSELKHICQSVESVKVDRYGLDLFKNYQFPQLHSLILIRVSDWKDLLHHKNLQNLKIWVKSDHINGRHRFLEPKSLLLPLRQFSSNNFFVPMCVHENLTYLNVILNGIFLLLDIIEQTPNVQHLLVNFDRNFDVWGKYADGDDKIFETMTLRRQRLSYLNSIAFTTMNDPKASTCNQCFPFYEVQFFIDNCCPNKTILKKVTLQLLTISFDENIWSTIQRYKNTFDSFNVYISFSIPEGYNLGELEYKYSSSNQFTFHIEDQSCDMPIHSGWLHLYSLPFVFSKLYGFTCYSKLNQQCSFLTVRHLYFTRYDQNRIFSFDSLEKQMPNLISISYRVATHHTCVTNTLENYDDILYNVHTLYYNVTCNNPHCIYWNQFCPTVNRMPNLKILATSYESFNQLNHPLIFIKKLHLYNCQYIDFDKFAILVPNLSKLLLTDVPSNSDQLSSWICSFFVRFPQLIIFSLKISYYHNRNLYSDEKVCQEVLTMIHNMDTKFQHLKLTCDHGRMVFSFPSL